MSGRSTTFQDSRNQVLLKLVEKLKSAHKMVEKLMASAAVRWWRLFFTLLPTFARSLGKPGRFFIKEQNHLRMNDSTGSNDHLRSKDLFRSMII